MPRRRTPAVGAVLLAVLVTAGCSADEPDPAPTPSASADARADALAAEACAAYAAVFSESSELTVEQARALLRRARDLAVEAAGEQPRWEPLSAALVETVDAIGDAAEVTAALVRVQEQCATITASPTAPS